MCVFEIFVHISEVLILHASRGDIPKDSLTFGRMRRGHEESIEAIFISLESKQSNRAKTILSFTLPFE